MYANLLGADLAIIDKRRHSGSKVSVKNLIGSVDGTTVLMFDDMISTAGTVCEAAAVVREHGAKEVHVACTHGLFVGMAVERLLESGIKSVITTDTVPVGSRQKALDSKLVVLSVAALLGEAVHRIHHDQSISALFTHGAGTKR
jgi:ribose-phosphate pyrophosphokinase